MAARSFSMSVSDASTIEEWGSLRKSEETMGSSVTGQDAAHRAGGRFLKGRVDRLRGRSTLKLDGQIHDGDVLDRHPEGHAGEPAGKLGKDLGHRAVGPCRGGDDVVGCRPGPAEVLVGQVLQALVGGVGVDGGHHPVLDAERVVQHFDHRHEAVRGAAPHRDDAVSRGVVGAVVDAHDEGRVLVLGRRRDDDFARPARIDVGARLGRIREVPRGLDDDLGAQVTPGLGSRLRDRQEPDRVATDHDGVTAGLDRRLEDAHRRVVLECSCPRALPRARPAAAWGLGPHGRCRIPHWAGPPCRRSRR